MFPAGAPACMCPHCGSGISSPYLTIAPPLHEYQSQAPFQHMDGPIVSTPRERAEDPAGLVCSILACVFGPIGFCFWPLLIVSFVLAIIGLVLCRNKGLALTGLLLTVIPTVAVILFTMGMLASVQFN